MKCKKCKWDIISDKYDGYCYMCYRDLPKESEVDKECEINQSICDLLLEKDKFKRLWKEALEVGKVIETKLYSIGAPLNDNVLKFDKNQLVYLQRIAEEIKTITEV